MGYYIDLRSITLDEYIEKLKNGYLPPSRKILLTKIEENFQEIKKQGLKNVAELREALKTKNKLNEFSVKTNLPKEYLVILIREIKSLWPKPDQLVDFPEIQPETIEKLRALGIITTMHLYKFIFNSKARKKLAAETGIEEHIVLKLSKLTDLSRVRWVNHTFAFILYETGYKTAKMLANADSLELHKAVVEINKKRGYFKGNVGLNDIRICIQAAKEISYDIIF